METNPNDILGFLTPDDDGLYNVRGKKLTLEELDKLLLLMPELSCIIIEIVDDIVIDNPNNE